MTVTFADISPLLHRRPGTMPILSRLPSAIFEKGRNCGEYQLWANSQRGLITDAAPTLFPGLGCDHHVLPKSAILPGPDRVLTALTGGSCEPAGGVSITNYKLEMVTRCSSRLRTMVRLTRSAPGCSKARSRDVASVTSVEPARTITSPARNEESPSR